MESMNIVRIRVEQAGYECDDYGYPECEPKSVKIACILAVKNALGVSLRDAKNAVESSIDDPRGRVVFSLILDDAGLGRLTRTVYERRAMNTGRDEHAQLTDIEILDIKTDRVITVGG
jgi:hypothetical protein